MQNVFSQSEKPINFSLPEWDIYSLWINTKVHPEILQFSPENPYTIILSSLPLPQSAKKSSVLEKQVLTQHLALMSPPLPTPPPSRKKIVLFPVKAKQPDYAPITLENEQTFSDKKNVLPNAQKNQPDSTAKKQHFLYFLMILFSLFFIFSIVLKRYPLHSIDTDLLPTALKRYLCPTTQHSLSAVKMKHATQPQQKPLSSPSTDDEEQTSSKTQHPVNFPRSLLINF